MAHMWGFKGLPPERIAKLSAPFEFEHLVARLAREAKVKSFKRERGDTEAKGASRTKVLLEVSPDAFDLFFNSPFGYRGRFLLGRAEGNRANALVTQALTAVSASQVIKFDEQARESLSSEHAKVWIDEKQHSPEGPDLVIEIVVPAWVRAAQAASDRYKAREASQDEIDRIYGVRAPVGTVLKLMGAWRFPDGRLRVVPSKFTRAEEIRDFGNS